MGYALKRLGNLNRKRQQRHQQNLSRRKSDSFLGIRAQMYCEREMSLSIPFPGANILEKEGFCMPELHNIEWKSTRKDEYLKWICGFANAQGGWIYIGMNAMIWITLYSHDVDLP